MIARRDLAPSNPHGVHVSQAGDMFGINQQLKPEQRGNARHILSHVFKQVAPRLTYGLTFGLTFAPHPLARPQAGSYLNLLELTDGLT